MNRTIAITRSPDDAAEFVSLAEGEGIMTYALPTIQLVSRGLQIVGEFLGHAAEYSPDYSVFMSSKAVRLLFETARQNSKLDELRLAVANTAVVAVGPKTGEALKEQGIRVNQMPPKTYSSVGVGEVFTGLNAVGKKVIIPRSGASTPFLKELLNKIGLDVLEVHLYDVCAFQDTTEWNGFRKAFSEGAVDGVVFTSASSVRGFFDIMSRDHDAAALSSYLQKTAVVAIGPFTADELKKFGVPNKISQVHTVSGAFDTLKDLLPAP